MARKERNPAAETLRDLEASGDRLAEWASENAAQILGAIVAILVIAAGIGLYLQSRSSARDAAADALAQVTSEYRAAMGADPVSGPIPEPANPKLAEETRSRFVDRFAAVADEHGATAAGALARLEAGQLQTQLGRLEDARASYRAVLEAAPPGAIAALAQVRLADLAERGGDLEAAARAYEAAAAIQAYPLRAEALAEAARCWAMSGHRDEAIAAYQRIQTDFPNASVPPEVESLIAEIRASADSALPAIAPN